MLVSWLVTSCTYKPYKPNEKYLNEAAQHIEKGNGNEAKELIEKAILKYPDYHEPYLVYASFLLTTNQNKKAYKQFILADSIYSIRMKSTFDPMGTVNLTYTINGVHQRYFNMKLEQAENMLELGLESELIKDKEEYLELQNIDGIGVRFPVLIARAYQRLNDIKGRDSTIQVILQSSLHDSITKGFVLNEIYEITKNDSLLNEAHTISKHINDKALLARTAINRQNELDETTALNKFQSKEKINLCIQKYFLRLNNLKKYGDFYLPHKGD